MPTREAQVLVQLCRAALQWCDGYIGERDEVALRRVQHIRDATAVAVSRQREHTLDPVSLGLDPDPLPAVVHAGGIALIWKLHAAHALIIDPPPCLRSAADEIAAGHGSAQAGGAGGNDPDVCLHGPVIAQLATQAAQRGRSDK